MRTKLVEAEDDRKINYGKFLMVGFEPSDWDAQSMMHNQSLLASLPVTRRLGPITPQSVWALDLQTQEGMIFSTGWSEKSLAMRFLFHPVKVCVLYFGALLYFVRNSTELWDPKVRLITIPTEDAWKAPSFLVDITGTPVRRFDDWSTRRPIPLGARFRNREIEDEVGDPEKDPSGQCMLTEEELQRAREPKGVW